jgi:alkylhydroperoxidase/carboxymuconolactone decarboxylase family protein YurZ
MSESQEQTPAQKLIGDFAPKLVSLTDDVLFDDVWERTELSKRDRSLITVAALIAGGNSWLSASADVISRLLYDALFALYFDGVV